jgi:SAM-dependent methyltransferase
MRLGRSFPSPSVLPVSDEELLKIGSWAKWNRVPADRVPEHYAGEARVLRGYSGAKALWRVEHGPVVETPPYVPPIEPVTAQAAAEGIAALGRYAEIMRCPKCHGALAVSGSSADCATCGAGYPIADECLDVFGQQEDLPDPLVTKYHTRYTRPAFMRLVGGLWGLQLTYEAENRMIPDFVRPADGPIVDLGPGRGITTRSLAGVFGADRLIAVDASAAMLRRLKRRIPEAAAIRASVFDLPFADATVGAVNCWNFLHGFADKTDVLDEIARCLKPGGSLTVMDLVPDTDPVSGHFQRRPGERKTHGLFGPDEITAALARAGLTVQEQVFPGGNVMVLRARRDS